MASENAITPPRIDRQFVDQQGRLTPYGYSVLTQLIDRVGGSVGEILNARDLIAAINSVDDALGRLDVLAAAVAEARAAIDLVRAGEMTMQSFTPNDPINMEVTWQI